MKIRRLLATFLLTISPLAAIAEAERDSGPTRILWLGSSSTYVHDLPRQVGRWLMHHGDMDSVTTHLAGKSGTGFHEYMRDGFEAQYGLEAGETLLEKIRRERNDFVVIQQITYFIADADSSEIIDKTATLVDAIREAGGEPVFYEMGWRLPAINETGRNMILREAQRHGITHYGPCSSAWKRVREERPDLELHNLPDTDHPGTLGNYLNMSCMYAALSGKSPVGLPAVVDVWPHFGSFDKEEAARRVASTVLAPYHAVLPGWMQAISAMRRQQELDPDVARFLQQVAWDVYRDRAQQLKQE